MAFWSIQHATDAIKVAAVVATMKMIMTTPALIVTTNRLERPSPQHCAAVMAYQRWTGAVLQFAADRQGDLKAE